MERKSQVPTSDWATRALWLLMILALVGLALYVLWAVREIITLLFVCGAIAYLLIPLVDWLMRWKPAQISALGWRGFISLLVVLGFTGLVVYASVAFISPFVREAKQFVNEYPNYQERITATLQSWQATYQEWYQGLPPEAQAWLDRQGESLSRSWSRSLDALQTRLQGALQQTGALITIAVELFLIPVVVFYLLFDSHRLKRETLRWLPPRYIRTALRVMNETNRVMRGYISAQLILGVIAGIATWIGLQIFGIKYAATLALFAGVARAIPVIGAVVAVVPIALMALLQGGIPLALKLVLFMTVLFVIEHKVILPKIVGDRVDLHPVLVIVVLLVSGKFFGLVGMFFGVPVAVIVRNVVVAQRAWARRRPKVHRLTVIEPSEATTTGTGGT